MKSKHLLLLTLFFIFVITSCKKETITNPDEVNKPIKPKYIEQASAYLKTNYTAGALSDLFIDASVVHKLKNGQFVIRVPFITDGGKNFILITADSARGLQKGRIFNIGQTSNTFKGEKFNGTITLKELSGMVIEVRKIVNGHNVSKKAISTAYNSQKTSTDPIYVVLPDIIITAPPPTITFQDNSYYSEWVSLGLLYDDHSYDYSYMFNPINSSVGSSEPYPNVIQVEFEALKNGNPVDLAKLFNCFNSISDIGASFSIKLCADIPVNGYPTLGVDVSLSPGHTFLTLTKTNGSENISQSFGFYPTSWLNILGFSVNSKIENNGISQTEHEYNVSIAMNNISADQFNQILSLSQTLAQTDYNLIGNNCTNYAVNVFNSIRTNPIEPYFYQAPIYGWIPDSPQGLYLKLQDEKAAGVSDIDVGGIWKAPTSQGGCN